MARKAAPRAGKSSSKTGAARKRVSSKPVIIDVEADKATQPSTEGKPSAPSSGGLDEATARAAGLSADRTKVNSAPVETAKAASAEVKKPTEAAPSSSSAPNGNATGPRAFVLAAAGFIGALAALALVFLAQLLGFVSVPNGQLDEQRAALLSFEEQVNARLTVLETAEPVAVDIDLGSIEADLTELRDDIAQLNADAVSDAEPVDLAAAVAEALAPLEERITAAEAALQSSATVQVDPDQASTDEQLAELPVAAGLVEVRDLIGEASTEIADLRSALATIQAELDTLAGAGEVQVDQTVALDERLSLLSSDTADRLEDLNTRIGQLGDGVAVMGDRLAAFEQAPVAVAPDQLARLGLALDGLAASSETGSGLGNAIAAAQGAAAFDAELASVLAPLSAFTDDTGLHAGGLLDHFDTASTSMLSAAPGSVEENAGLLDALGERARQMVTIRGPGDSTAGTPETVSGQIDQLGSLLASGQYEAALTLFDALPDTVRAAGDELHTALSARVTLDSALTQARAGLLAALASSNQ